jgi:hypothetical protein
MSEHEKLGSFYLGNLYDMAAGQAVDAKLLYDSRDLTTHAVCVGMTGSGKTGLCLSLLEEALLDGVPALAIDPKGDLGNLLLVDPEFKPEFYAEWIDPGEAARKGVAPDDYAAQVAGRWRAGLAASGVSDDSIARYAAIDKAIYTPGSTAGIPLSVLKSFDAPPAELLGDAEAVGDRIASTVSGLLTLMGIDADPVQSREHIFLSTLLGTAWRAGRSLTLTELIREMQSPPFTQVGVLDLETFFPTSERTKLTLQLNNLLASPTFSSWIEGAPLDIGRLLYTDDGRPRLAILSIAHLSDSERMFFVTLLLSEVLAWMRAQPGTSSLRALLYMDEVFGYFPPLGNPPSKTPMLTLLKQARAYGLGCVLATQNPVDLDYKGLSNAGTWLLGRLQTERDKLRVIDGLEGAAGQSGSGLDKKQLETTLSGLGNRVFLMNNVHGPQPQVFMTRWAMSYLRGPLTRTQIKRLMDPVREKFLPPATDTVAGTVTGGCRRPVVPGDVEELFAEPIERVATSDVVEYHPGLLGEARLHYEKSNVSVDHWQSLTLVATVHGTLASDPWQQSIVRSSSVPCTDGPLRDTQFAALPSELASSKSYKSFARDLADHLYRDQRLTLSFAPAFNRAAQIDESELAFKQRLAVELAGERAAAERQLRDTYDKKLAAAQSRVDKAQAYYDEQNSQFWVRVMGMFWKVIDLILAATSGKSTSRRTSSSASAARQAATERGQATRAKQKLDAALAERDDLMAEQQRQLEQLATKYDPATIVVEPLEIVPKKGDIAVQRVALVWLPGRVDERGGWIPLW